jgi:hypothetical protein
MTLNYSETVDVTQLGYPNTIPDDFLDLWFEAIQPFFDELNKDFTRGLKSLKRYERYTAYSFLKDVFLPARLPTKWEDYDEIISAIELQLVGVGM